MANPSPDDKVYGKYGLRNTFSVPDQVPLPFASCDKRTIEFIGCKRVLIKQAGSGLDKRQCSLQLLIRPMGVQPRPCLISRGPPVPKGAKRLKKRSIEMAQHALAANSVDVRSGRSALGLILTLTLVWIGGKTSLGRL